MRKIDESLYAEMAPVFEDLDRANRDKFTLTFVAAFLGIADLVLGLALIGVWVTR